MELVKIIKYLDKKFNPNLAAKWDKIGFQILDNKKYNINPDREINNILVTLDVTKKVVDYAIENKVDLIISRHPFIFNQLDMEKTNPAKKQLIKQLIENDIYIYSIHTNYDLSPNQIFQTMITSEFDVKDISRSGFAKEIFTFKLKSEIKLEELFSKIKSIFKSDEIDVNIDFNNKKTIKQFSIAAGSAGTSMVYDRLENSTFITGEVKWNEWVYAQDNNIDVIAIGHYMENYFIDDLSEKLLNSFQELNVDKIDVRNMYKGEK